MPKLSYSGEMPTPEQFRADLEGAMAAANPIDDLLMLAEELSQFERQYGMSSQEFYDQYESDMLDDDVDDYFEWMVVYTLFMKTKRSLEVALMRAAVRPEVAELA